MLRWVADTRDYLEDLAKASLQVLVGSLVALVGLSLAIFTLYAQPPLFIIECAAVIAVAIVGVGINHVIKQLRTIYPSLRYTEALGSARMGSRKDLVQAKLLDGEATHIYCGLKDREPVYYKGKRHLMTLGPTRSGKDTALLVPNLHRLKRSVIVIDPKGELAAITARYRKRFGHVVIFDPFGELRRLGLSHRSDGYNPFAIPGFNVRDREFYSQAISHAESVVNLERTNEVHFPERGRDLFAACDMRSKWLEHEGKGPSTMRRINAMLRARGEMFRKVIDDIAQHSYKPMAQLLSHFPEDDREVNSVIATVHGQTRFLNDEVILDDMDKHPKIDGKPFDFEMLKHQIITVYVILPENRLSTHAVWLRLIVASALDALTRSGPGPIVPLLIINEAGNLGRLDALTRAMGMVAGRGLTLWTLWQTLAHLPKTYGAEGLEDFLQGAAVLNSFRANDNRTAEYLSARLGDQTVKVKSYNLNKEAKASGQGISPQGHALRHPNDLLGLEDGRILSWIEPSSRAFELDAPGYWDLGLKGLDPNPYFKPEPARRYAKRTS
jgi:type IV secretion system protein VirD4